MKHISTDDLELYAMGRLSAEQAGRVEEHLLICARCRSRLVRIEEIVRLIRHALRQCMEENR